MKQNMLKVCLQLMSNNKEFDVYPTLSEGDYGSRKYLYLQSRALERFDRIINNKVFYILLDVYPKLSHVDWVSIGIESQVIDGIAVLRKYGTSIEVIVDFENEEIAITKGESLEDFVVGILCMVHQAEHSLFENKEMYYIMNHFCKKLKGDSHSVEIGNTTATVYFEREKDMIEMSYESGNSVFIKSSGEIVYSKPEQLLHVYLMYITAVDTHSKPSKLGLAAACFAGFFTALSYCVVNAVPVISAVFG